MLFYSRNHYVEYLCSIIRKEKIDSLPILGVDDLEIVVRRANKRMPPRPYSILEGVYREYLLEVGLACLAFCNSV